LGVLFCYNRREGGKQMPIIDTREGFSRLNGIESIFAEV